MASTTQKRQKESKRLEKKNEKDAARKQRRDESGPKPSRAHGVDPDIEGIVPGPQPVTE
jgi:hypothetical protein